jgi:hypothetical protein
VGRTIAYFRVSSRDQNPQLQLDALHAHGYDQLFAEKQSGKHGTARPEFTRALAALLWPGDTPVFWKSDRWGRSAAHVLTTIGELRDRGVTVKSLTENFDLDTKEGRFMFSRWCPTTGTSTAIRGAALHPAAVLLTGLLACQLAGHGSRRTPRWPAGVPGRWYPGSARGPTDLAAPVGWC